MRAAGVDLVSLRHMERIARRYQDDVLTLVFTPAELAQASSARWPARHLGICFGAKEAVGKALGCGLRGIEWTDVETTVRGSAMAVSLSGAAARRLAALGGTEVAASWAALADRGLVVVLASLT